ncbi:MAG: class I tRNA ligase family protein, partial [Desulfobulbaceae bacterium]|nr:class I tRNA ligase family protein [Desulfobulbaceae bacterium]
MTDPSETSRPADADLAKAYDFKAVEPKWYLRWLQEKKFSGTMEDGRPNFSIVIPPPNVTGVLHVG